eukprot:CAMPEP_0175045604 /NCGR_PEP_ID=MMETSP0052_2-20121109/4525_1 /TAXON_ID=51329 ORGANISM="Polytomella parva, Strain SAG 63-3" /NCGR_SAMPLE_ID=MMETSP0052_2 /ASSEMBLY_ACC=CAM_ASM_000194 /LENGTH=416 /DNA_ID=CAMNT_0016309173 /DNA_START=332 /DNA_END=1582 /DNA_ORIENTATION=-
MKNDRFLIASAALVLACKVEGHPRHLDQITDISFRINKGKLRVEILEEKDRKDRDQYRQDILLAERLLLMTLDFQTCTPRPYVALMLMAGQMGLLSNGHPNTLLRANLNKNEIESGTKNKTQNESVNKTDENKTSDINSDNENNLNNDGKKAVNKDEITTDKGKVTTVSESKVSMAELYCSVIRHAIFLLNDSCRTLLYLQYSHVKIAYTCLIWAIRLKEQASATNPSHAKLPLLPAPSNFKSLLTWLNESKDPRLAMDTPCTMKEVEDIQRQLTEAFAKEPRQQPQKPKARSASSLVPQPPPLSQENTNQPQSPPMKRRYTGTPSQAAPGMVGGRGAVGLTHCRGVAPQHLIYRAPTASAVGNAATVGTDRESRIEASVKSTCSNGAGSDYSGNIGCGGSAAYADSISINIEKRD